MHSHSQAHTPRELDIAPWGALFDAHACFARQGQTLQISCQASDWLTPAGDGRSRCKAELRVTDASGRQLKFLGILIGLGQDRSIVFQYTGTTGPWLDLLRIPNGVSAPGTHRAMLYPVQTANEIRRISTQMANPLVQDARVRSNLTKRRAALERTDAMELDLDIKIYPVTHSQSGDDLRPRR